MDHQQVSASLPESAWHSAGGWQLSEGVWETAGGGQLCAAFPRAREVVLSLQVELGPDTELSLKLGFRHDLDASGDLGSGMDGAYLFRCGQGRGERYTIERLGCAGGRLNGECWEPDVAVPGSHLFTCAARDGLLSLSMDDVEIISVRDFYHLTHLDAVCVATGGPARVRPAPSHVVPAAPSGRRSSVGQREFEFHVTIDADSDIAVAQADWDEEALRSLVRTYAAWGVGWLYWLDYEGRDGGIWDPSPWHLFGSRRPQKFIHEVPEPMAVLSDECHRQGMKAGAVIKPFDLAYGMPFVVSPDDEPCPTGFPIVGGWAQASTRFIREHPELRMRLHPSLFSEEPPGAIEEIDIYHWGAEPLGLEARDFFLWTSDNNHTFARFEGECSFEERTVDFAPPRFVPAPEEVRGTVRPCRRIRWSGLHIEAPYVAIELREGAAGKGIANFLSAMVEIRDGAGDPLPFTYGLISNQPHRKEGGYQPGDFRELGIGFDAARRTFMAQWGRGGSPQQSAGRHPFTLSPGGWIGLAVGRNLYPTGCADPCFPEVRDWLLGRIRKLLELGADGVDLRFVSHNESLDWENYGFSEPVIQAYRERYGVDITREAFDRPAWRRLRGEYIDMLVQGTSEVAAEFGAAAQVHIDAHMASGPEGNAFFEIGWDWQRWIAEGWVDGITLKEGPETLEALDGNTFWRAVIEAAGERGIRVYSCAKGALTNPPEWFEKGLESGLSGFNLYESANLLRLSAAGQMECRNETVRRAIENFRARARDQHESQRLRPVRRSTSHSPVTSPGRRW